MLNISTIQFGSNLLLQWQKLLVRVLHGQII